MSLESIIAGWKEVRLGLVEEVRLIPTDQLNFKPTNETRTVAELLQHVIETQKVLVGEVCRPDTNLMRQSFAEHINSYAPGVRAVADKEGLLNLLRMSLEEAKVQLRAANTEMDKMMKRFDGREMLKADSIRFAISHEMYHRGQLTVYERLLNIEPALTRRFKKLFSEPQQPAVPEAPRQEAAAGS